MRLGTALRRVFASDLCAQDKLVLLCLLRYADNATHQAWPSSATIADDTGLGRRTVQRSLASLEARGIIASTARTRASDGAQTSSIRELQLSHLSTPPTPDRHRGYASQAPPLRLTGVADLPKGSPIGSTPGKKPTKGRSVVGTPPQAGANLDIDVLLDEAEVAYWTAAPDVMIPECAEAFGPLFVQLAQDRKAERSPRALAKGGADDDALVAFLVSIWTRGRREALRGRTLTRRGARVLEALHAWRQARG